MCYPRCLWPSPRIGTLTFLWRGPIRQRGRRSHAVGSASSKGSIGDTVFDDLQREDVAGTIDQMVEQLLHAAGVTGPPVDAIALAQRHLGMVVCLDKRQAQRGRAQRHAGKPQIYLRPEPTEERHQWTVAHEIGEHLKTELLQRLKIEPAQTRAMTGESLANLFAYRLLVPSCWFGAHAQELS